MASSTTPHSPIAPVAPQTGIAHRTFGASGLEVPVLCFGGGDAFFKVWGNVQQDLANRLVDVAIDGGVNFFDTANIYSDGLAETILGNALKGKRGNVWTRTWR